MEEKPARRRLEVWMDGQCPICRQSRCWVEARDPEARIRFRDFRRATDAELPVARRMLEKEMWVRLDDGSLVAGFAGWQRIMAGLPRWRWLAMATALPPMRWIGTLVYRLIARYRFALSRGRAQ